MSSVGNGSASVDCWMAVSVHCRANWSGILVNSDFTSKDTSLYSWGICTSLITSIKFSVDCSLRLDLDNIRSRIAFTIQSAPTLRHLLTNVKDKDEPNNRQGAIYKIECSDCQASYIGETGRNLNTRLTEHKRATRKFHSSNKIRFSSLLLRIHLLSKITHINCCSNVKNWIAKYDLSSVRNVEPNTWHQLS